MRLLITTPAAVIIDDADVASIRAEDESGSFGILNDHADFLTTLTSSIVSWRHADGRPGYCAVRRGVLTVTGGREVAVATREAIVGDDLDVLADTVLARFRAATDAEQAARADVIRLHVMAIRQIVKYLRPERVQMRGDGM